MRLLIVLIVVLSLLSTPRVSGRPAHAFNKDGHTYIPALSLKVVNLEHKSSRKRLRVNKNGKIHATYYLWGGKTVTYWFGGLPDETDDYDFKFKPPAATGVNFPGYYYYHPKGDNVTFHCKRRKCTKQ